MSNAQRASPVDQPTKSPTRKVMAMVWILVAAVVLLVALLAVRELLLPGVAELDVIITALSGAVPVLITAIVAAYQTRERA